MSFLILLAESAGHPLDADEIDPNVVMAAMIVSFDGEEQPLAEAIAGLVQSDQ